MDRYRIIGKSKQMSSVYLMGKDGNFEQHRILLGKQMEVDEDQITFHVHRLVAKKIIQLVKIASKPKAAKIKEVEVVEPAPEVEEIFVVEETPAVAIEEIESNEAVALKPKKGRGRKKKISAE